MNGEFLAFRHIRKAFGGNVALNDITFSVKKGTVHVLAGENGAGKSTLLKILAGIHAPDAGEVWIDGKSVVIRDPRQAQELGVAMVFQELTLINDLTIEENLFLNMEPTNSAGLIHKKEMRAKLGELMKTYGISINPKSIAGRLSVAEQQMAEILKVLLRDPQIIILDEPTSSLATQEVEKLFQIVNNLKANGKTILFISHRMEEVFAIGDEVTVFKDGQYIGTKDLKEIDVDGLIRMMVGRPLTQIYPPKQSTVQDDVVLKAEHLQSNVLNDVSLELHKGEILGIAGLQGHGQAELLNALSGLHALKSKKIEIDGKPVKIQNARQALNHGIALVPGDRKQEGLMLILPIIQNLALCSLNKRSKFGILNLKKEKEFARKTQKDLSIKLHKLSDPVSSLSGGNQQKVVLGKELAIDPKIMLFNDPTRGIDVEAKSDFYKIMREQAKEGMGVILCSSDMMEVIGMSDRVLVMYEGRISACLEGDQINEEKIMRCAMGIVEDTVGCSNG